MKRLYVIFFLLFPYFIQAQNCKINTATQKVCLGNTLLFTVSIDAGFTATTYNWNFGNAATSNQATPVYQYPARGKYVPSVTINFSNSTSCTIKGDTIQVVDNPKANFSVSTALTQCFNNNLTCMDDISTVGLDNAAITSRLFLFGDGGSSNLPPGTGNTACHAYANPLGGVYTLVLEVMDANNCLSRKERTDYITIYAKMQEVSFKTNYVTQCNKTPALFTNTSKIPLAQIAKYSWDFGDGQTATTPWAGLTHIYSKSGLFTAKLFVEDKNGCKDSFAVSPAGENYVIDSAIYLNQTTSCYYHNGFRIASKNYYFGSSSVYWATYKIGNPVRIDTIFNSPTDGTFYIDSINFYDCGKYQIRMYVKIGNCFVRTDTIVTVLGPKSVIETHADAIINSVQCEIHDTVIFRSPVGDHSCYYYNFNLLRIWDFDDPFAPPCTTDTKNGKNIGMNCRYSKDSSTVRHAYKPGQDNCYYPRLILTDLISGCSDTSKATMKLTQPDAGWDSTITPIRRGLYYKPKVPCLDDIITFYLDETLPKCGREMAWFLADSACKPHYWQAIDTPTTFTHVYTSTCDPKGFVTVGLIIKNGKDKYGNDCYDTAWYHNMFRFFPLNPQFDLVRTNTGCGPWKVKLSMIDSIQDSLKSVAFSFGTTGGNIVINFGPTDSIIPSQYFTYLRQGSYTVTVALTNTRNCIRTFNQVINFGFLRNFKPDRPVLCLSDSVTLIDDIQYYNSLYQYWRDPARALAGKERVFWDMGDGKGFIKSGGLPKYRYDKIGNYFLRMVAIDSLGCKDTFPFLPSLKVVSLDAIIKPMQPRYLCSPQILSFIDLSVYADSSGPNSQAPYDTLLYWTWSFGDNKLNSLLQNPFHDYTANGTYPVKLIAQTSKGCIDSAFIPIWIDGPRPRFDIVSDTVGCAPFTVDLKNTTGYPLVNWIYYFRDQNNSTASTQLDTNVKHVYTKGGVYKIYLVGEDTVFNPLSGQYKTCLAVFPDSNNINAPKRVIRVIDPVKAKLEVPDTVCLGVPFNMTARPDQLIPGFGWIFGDTSANKQTLYPDTIIQHSYSSLGVFRAKMYPIMLGAQCTDTAQKDIAVTTVAADFDMDQTQSPNIQFNNKSLGATRYEWDFGHPASGSKNHSTEVNPMHSFVGEGGSYTVCLIAYNNQDCWDSLCKKTEPVDMRLRIPNVFTPDNNDGLNDAYDIDIVGYTVYGLVIYNRWGNKVYESNKDGFGNDGINWNGKNFNVGPECPEGVYYFVFKYQMLNQTSPKMVSGTITLIRDEN